MKITAKEGFLTTYSYNLFERTVNINFKQLEKLKIWNREGVPYTPSLLEVLEHEIGHAADSKVYNYNEAQTRRENSILGTLRQIFMPFTEFFSADRRTTKRYEEYTETPLITQSNTNLLNAFEDSGRRDYEVEVKRKGILGWFGFKEKRLPYSNQEEIPSHLKKSEPVRIAPELSTDTAFPLPILSAKSAEEARNPITAETIAKDLKNDKSFNLGAIALDAAYTATIIGPATSLIGVVTGRVCENKIAAKHLKPTKEK